MSARRYEIIRELGIGNFSAGVYLALHKDIDRPVALKLLEVGASQHRDDLLAEAKVMGALPAHENVVQVLDAGDWDAKLVYIASEPCLNGSLDGASKSPMDPASACRTVSDVCRGLQFMHGRGILHLDIRPANILLCGTRPKLCDFGLARWITNASVTSVYANHAAPEMLATFDGSYASDQYAMAMTLAHLLTAGAVCSTPPTPPTQANWQKWNPLSGLGSNVPSRLVKVLRRATRYKASDRYASVEDLKQAIDAATPATAFYPPIDGKMNSADGAWSITTTSTARGEAVEVRRSGRRRTHMGITGTDPRTASRHVRELINQFASERP